MRLTQGSIVAQLCRVVVKLQSASAVFCRARMRALCSVRTGRRRGYVGQRVHDEGLLYSSFDRDGLSVLEGFCFSRAQVNRSPVSSLPGGH